MESQKFLIDIIEEISFVRVSNDDLLWTNKILDSITIIELVVELEKKYAIKIPMNDIVVEHFETIDLILTYLTKNGAQLN
jgi:acyl carrier protein